GLVDVPRARHRLQSRFFEFGAHLEIDLTFVSRLARNTPLSEAPGLICTTWAPISCARRIVTGSDSSQMIAQIVSDAPSLTSSCARAAERSSKWLLTTTTCES